MKNHLLVLGIAVFLGATADDAEAVMFKLKGTFESSARPGSAEIFQRLENGSIDGSYSVPDGSLPGEPGDVLGLSTFDVNLRDRPGNVVINYNSGTDFGAIFFQFFGPTVPDDEFVFNNVETQLQLVFPRPFNGIGTGDADAVFGVGSGPSGGINVSKITSVPEPLTILGSGLALGFGAYFKKEYSRKQKKTKAKA